MKIIQELSLDTSRKNTFKVIYAKQYDTDSRYLKITITTKGEIQKIAAGSTVIFNVERADSQAKSFSGSANADGTITVQLPNWMLMRAGECLCSVSAVDGGERLSTLNFTVCVEEFQGSDDNIFDDEIESNPTVSPNSISITSFTASPSEAVSNTTVDVTLSWTVNGTPTSQKLNGKTIDASSREYTVTGVTETQVWVLEVADANSSTKKYASLTFSDKYTVYYGDVEKPASYSSEFFDNLTSKSTSSHIQFPSDTSENQYIFYCYPSSMSTLAPTFTVNGFTGGFISEGEVTVNGVVYSIYRSKNANLGTKTVQVN